MEFTSQDIAAGFLSTANEKMATVVKEISVSKGLMGLIDKASIHLI
jgi:N-methylhydantoinase A/oxoprolinase/acetone carboxylase beta subunit